MNDKTKAKTKAALLFLDIDDVLCLNLPYGGYDSLAVVRGQDSDAMTVFAGLFEPRACQALKQVHEAMNGELHYVISSTWREFFDRAQMDRVFRASGLGFVADALHDELRWCTPPSFGRSRRIDDIASWLDRHHQGEPFAIVDDMLSGPSLKPALSNAAHPFAGRVVLCQEFVGLLDEHVGTIVDALGRAAPGAPEEGAR